MKEADRSKIGSLGMKKKKCPLLPLLIIAFMIQVTILKNHIKSLLFGKIPTYDQDLLAIFANVNNYFALFATHSLTNFKKMHCNK